MLDVLDVSGGTDSVIVISNLSQSSTLAWFVSLLPSLKTLLYILAPVSLVLCAASGLVHIIIRQQISPLRRLCGPKSPSFFTGNLAAMHDMENNNLIATWEKEHGPAFIYHGLFGGCRLMITDPRAVAHVLGNAYEYPKPDFVRDSLASMSAGHDGLLTSEGEQHRRQRRIISPAFSAASIKAVFPIFWDKASELRDIWIRIIDDDDEGVGQRKEPNSGMELSGRRIDALAWLGRATLDVIGLAGFGYRFNSLTDESNELALAFAAVFSTARKFRVMTILQAWFPILRVFREENEVEARTRAKIKDIGLSLIAERKKAALADSVLSKSKEEPKDTEKDLLSILIRSNLARTPSQQMSTQEILCQISTFMAAGHETTASALVWTLYALAKHCDVQNRLRQALLVLSPSSPLDEDLLRLEYLDWVVRESLRLYAPVSSTMRVCESPRGWDEIPLSGTVMDRYGCESRTVRVRRGDIVSIPIAAVNRRKEVWGEDALEFKPERWKSPPSSTNAIPGLWSNILTFLNGNPVNGNRSCIGYKFAIAEIKIFLYVLLRDLDFSIDPSLVIERKVNVVTRPCVKSEPECGNQMPLLIRRVSDVSLPFPGAFGSKSPQESTVPRRE